MKTTCACGQPRYAKGKCRKCYLKAHYQANKKKYAAYYRANRERIRAYCKGRLEHARQRHRRYMGLPEPTRPSPQACELCGTIPPRYALALDHDHRTGKFRGWLCRQCNGALALIGDTSAALKRALRYVERAE